MSLLKNFIHSFLAALGFSLLRSDFLWLLRARATLVTVPRPLIEVAFLVDYGLLGTQASEFAALQL